MEQAASVGTESGRLSTHTAESAEPCSNRFRNPALIVQPGTCRQHLDEPGKAQCNGSLVEAEGRV